MLIGSEVAYVGLVLMVGGERLVELAVAARNARWAFARGAYESGRGHYPAMVAVQVVLLAGCVGEVVVLDRPFLPAVGWPALGLVVAAQGLRWWCVASLGRHWNTRVIVVPGAPLVRRGPYRWLRHPNYVAVVVEGVALPLVHSAWLTALVFLVAKALVLRVRIRTENRALGLA